MPQSGSDSTYPTVQFSGATSHNAEQLRLIRCLYKLLEPGAVLVLESATTRNPALRHHNCVEVMWPETHRGAPSITHLPSRHAVRSWLEMAGFSAIRESNCYKQFNEDLIGHRIAYFAQRLGEVDMGFASFPNQL